MERVSPDLALQRTHRASGTSAHLAPMKRRPTVHRPAPPRWPTATDPRTHPFIFTRPSGPGPVKEHACPPSGGRRDGTVQQGGHHGLVGRRPSRSVRCRVAGPKGTISSTPTHVDGDALLGGFVHTFARTISTVVGGERAGEQMSPESKLSCMRAVWRRGKPSVERRGILLRVVASSLVALVGLEPTTRGLGRRRAPALRPQFGLPARISGVIVCSRTRL